MPPFANLKDVIEEGFSLLVILVMIVALIVAAAISGAEACPEKKPKEPEADCGMAWPCWDEATLCPAENKQPIDGPHHHEGPCFCLGKDGWSLIWFMEYYPDGINIEGRHTEWGTCDYGSETPYCEIDADDTTVCGAALLQWLRYLKGWFDNPTPRD